MKRLAPWIMVAAYIGLCGLSYGSECEELLPGEKPSGEIRVCTLSDFLPEWFSCTTDTDCYEKCIDLAKKDLIDPELCEEA